MNKHGELIPEHTIFECLYEHEGELLCTGYDDINQIPNAKYHLIKVIDIHTNDVEESYDSYEDLINQFSDWVY